MNTLVLIHGWGTTGGIWQRQVEAFRPKGVRVLAPTLAVWKLDFLINYFKELNLAETCLAGWSLGGMLLLEALCREGLAPAGWVLFATPARFCQGPDFPLGQPPALVRGMRRALRDRAPEVLADFARRCLAPREAAWGEEMADYFRPTADIPDLAAGLDYLLRSEVRPLLSRAPAGAVVIHGEEDPIVSPAQGEFLARNLPGARLCLLPGAGHAPFVTQAGRVHEFLLEIIEGG
uniref:Alpha/beta fold hydrolase n=1 Tax=Desulfobacca acetoxidans TaxID=60893 RepID=A0A7V4G9R8_9BACT